MERVFFQSWEGLIRTVVAGLLTYIVLIAFLRVSGKRTLSKMNAFDFVVTVALGSTLATILINKNVALAEGAAAFALLIGMQFAVTWSSVRFPWIRRLVTGEPKLMTYRGRYLPDALRSARVTKDEIQAAVRAAGLADIYDAEAIVLETDGSFSVVRMKKRGQDGQDFFFKPPR